MNLKIKHKHFYIASMILFGIFVVIKMKADFINTIEGKLVFDSVRHKSGIYVYENNKLRFITDKANFPRWNANGNKIIATKNNEILIINANNKDVEKTIDTGNGQVIATEFSRDDKFVIYVYRIRNEEFFDYFIVQHFLKNGERIILAEFLNKRINFAINNFFVSNNNEFLTFSAGDNLDFELYLLNIQSKELASVLVNAYPIGWTKNGKLFIFSNKDNYGRDIENAFGVILEMDIKTNEVSFVSPFTFSNLNRIKLTRDGKYIYYSKQADNNGIESVYIDIGDNNKIIKETEILEAKFVDESKGFSRDLDPDWFVEI